jgi:hypothetical protein
MFRARVCLALLVVAMAMPAAALAHRRATKAERAAVVAAVVHQGKLSSAQARCQVVTISTVNRGYAVLAWPAKLSKACLRVAANGVIVEHRVAAHWDFLTEGSSLQCPIKGLPTSVAHDLDICS